MRRMFGLVLLPVLMVTLGLPIFPVMAQTQATWCWEDRFASGDGGYSPNQNGNTYAIYFPGLYWGSVYNNASQGHSELRIFKTLATTGHFTRVSMTYASDTPTLNDIYALNFSVNFGQQSGGPEPITVSVETDITTNNLRIDLYKASINTNIIVQKIRYEGDGNNPFGSDNCSQQQLTRPLNSNDEVATSSLYDQSVIGDLATHNFQDYQVYPVLWRGGVETVSAWSKAPGAMVHAAKAGSIESVHPLGWDDCGLGFASPSSLNANDPQTVVYTEFKAQQKQPCLVRRFQIQGTTSTLPDYADIAKAEYYLDPTNGYVVTLRISQDQRIQYLVRNALRYVVVGDTVDAGCVLGESMPLTALPVQAVNFSNISAVSGAVAFVGGPLSFVAGFISAGSSLAESFIAKPTPETTDMGYTQMTLYGAGDAKQAVYSNLTIDPTNTDRCSQSGDYKDCLAFNPQFANNGEAWRASGNVVWTNPGVTLDPGESVITTLNLNATGEYTATAFTQTSDGTAGEIRIFLGLKTTRLDVPLEWTSRQLTASPLGAPDAGTFYSLGVENTGTTPIEVRSLCVTDGAPNTGPNSCYFNNQSFQQGVSGWTVSSNVATSDSSLLVPNGSTIAQNVMLNPKADGAAIYKLSVRGDWWYNGRVNNIATAAIQYEWPAGTGYRDMTPQYIYGGVAYGLGTLEYSTDITVTATTSGVMNIKVVTTDGGDMQVQGIRITDACLSPKNGGSFPGQGGGGAPPPITADCTYVSRPENNEPASWLQWHWLSMRQFYKCDMMVLLNKMYKLGQDSYNLAGWQARYWQSTATVYSDWLGKQMFPWLGGHFRNIALGRVTTIYQAGGQCNDLFCVLNTLISGVLTPLNTIVNTLLGVITTATNLLLTIITGIIGLALAFLQKLFGLFNTVSALLTGLVSAYTSAAPVTIPGLPMCNINPTSSPFCRATWLLDNTILSDRWGILLTLIIAIATIHLILWAIGEFRSAIVNIGDSS